MQPIATAGTSDRQDHHRARQAFSAAEAGDQQREHQAEHDLHRDRTTTKIAVLITAAAVPGRRAAAIRYARA
jgi:hypothetical protein